jgi:hypothetical protein
MVCHISLSALVDTVSLLLPISLLSHTCPLPVTLGFYYASHFRLPLLLPSAPTDLSGPIVWKHPNRIDLALPVLKRIHHYIEDLFMLVTHLNYNDVSLPFTVNIISYVICPTVPDLPLDFLVRWFFCFCRFTSSDL